MLETRLEHSNKKLSKKKKGRTLHLLVLVCHTVGSVVVLVVIHSPCK